MVALLIFSAPALAADLPLNPAVTQPTIGETICVPGWTKTVRPPARYTARIKIKLIRELELPEELLTDFELDHRIPLALGGSPDDPRNLELQALGRGAPKGQSRKLLGARRLRRQDQAGRRAGAHMARLAQSRHELRRGRMMGWRGKHNREQDAREEWAKLPLRERYDWGGIALTLATLVVVALAVFVLPHFLKR